MIGVILGLILVCVILGVLWWAINQLLPLIPLAEPFRTILRVLMVLLLVVIVVWVIVTLVESAGFRVPLMHVSRLLGVLTS